MGLPKLLRAANINTASTAAITNAAATITLRRSTL
jgi:hypothetical protein